MSLCTQVVMRMPAGGGRVYAALCARPGTRFDNKVGGGHVVRCKEHAPANRTTGDWMRCALRWVIGLALLIALVAAFTNGWLWR